MYQQSNPYSNDGAKKISGPGANNGMMMANSNGYGGAAGGGGGGAAAGNGDGAAYNSGYGMGGYGMGGYGMGGMGGSMYGGSDYGGYGPGGPSGDQASMYGGGSLYAGGGGVGSMMGDMNENIVVTKLFSSRRDLDRVASAVDFSRRFDSNWGSYRSLGADGYGGSIYGNPAGADAAGSLMNLGAANTANSMMDRGIGAAGMGPDGGAKEARPTPKTTKAAVAPPPPSQSDAAKPANGVAEKKAEEKKASVKSPTPASKPAAPTPAQVKKPVEAKPPVQTPAKTVAAQPEEAAPKSMARSLPVQPPAPAPAEKAVEKPPAQPAPQEAVEKKAPTPRQQFKMVARETTPAASQAPPPPAPAPQHATAVQKPREAPPLDDIPLLAEDVRPKKKTPTPAAVKQAPTPKTVTPAAPAKAPTPQEVAAPPPPPPQKTPAGEVQRAREVTPEAAPAEKAKAEEKTRPMRPRSRPQSRPQSRMTSMSVVEFPEADEVKDEMVQDGLKDPEKEAHLNAAREEQRRQREEASRQARLERAKQRQAQEDLQRQREEEARQAREAKAEEERQKKELIAKMDEETRQERAAALAARERQREEEKRRFEEAKRAEEEKEAARAQAAIAERQRQLAEKEAQEKEAQAEKPSRPVSRPRSRRPTSRPNSNLRGAIPEQPPDLVAGQIKDTLAEDNLSRRTNTSVRSAPHADNAATATEARSTPRHAARAQLQQPRQSPSQIPHPPAPQEAEEVPPPPQHAEETQADQRSHHTPTPAEPKASGHSSQPSHGSKNSQSSARPVEAQNSQDAAAAAPPRKEPNMVRTLVLMEKLRESNHAVQVGDKSVTYGGTTVNVTEVAQRDEDNFNYTSTVVHDVREAACRGYNAAVLSMDASNTAGRFDSPVWSILNRVVRALLEENTNEDGVVRENFEVTCALGYLYRDKLRDLFAPEGESQFEKLHVNPSPIYGPRLLNLNYHEVTGAAPFEELLSSTLSQAGQDPTIASLSEGVLAAFVLIKQTRETDGKPDLYLSSMIIASCGEDPAPYQAAISHSRNEYATVFHLVLGGPSCTCFMLNMSDDDTVRKSGDASQRPVSESLENAMALLQQMASMQNYDLRSGSVKRFIKFVERSHANARARLANEQDESQRRKVERYLREQERLLEDAYGLLAKANVPTDQEL